MPNENDPAGEPTGEVENTPTTTETGAQAGAVATPSAQPPQQQGPDWNSLGVPFDQAQQRLNYFNELEQRYKSDPAWAQKYDQLYGGQQQQQQQHPLAWAKYDDTKQQSLRQAAIEQARAQSEGRGYANPDLDKHSQLMNDFYYNPMGTLSQMLTHPDVQGALYEAMGPQIQDMAQRMIQQSMQPVNQFMHRQGQQQFNQMYGKAFEALPAPIMDLYKAGRFGQTGSMDAVVNAIEAAKGWGQQQPPEGQPPAPTQPAKTSANGKPAERTPGKKRSPDEDLLEDAAKSWGRLQTAKK